MPFKFTRLHLRAAIITCTTLFLKSHYHDYNNLWPSLQYLSSYFSSHDFEILLPQPIHGTGTHTEKHITGTDNLFHSKKWFLSRVFFVETEKKVHQHQKAVKPRPSIVVDHGV
jgi:hypothetical protein